MRLLLIEDSPMDARIVESMLAAAPGLGEWVTVDSLKAGVQEIRSRKPDLVLLDLFLGDSQGINTFSQLQDHSPGVPVIVLTSLDDEGAALQALKNGAQDYLVKGTFDWRALHRSIRYAIERQNLLTDLEERARELEASEARYRRMIMANPDGVVILGADGAIRFMNPAAELILGRTYTDCLGKQWPYPLADNRTVEIDFPRGEGPSLVVESLGANTVWEGDRATLITLRVITQHVQLREFLKDLAVTDDVTGLYNRRGFVSLLEHQLRVVKRYGRCVTVMSLAVGGAETVLEHYGPLELHNLLVSAAKVITSVFRGSDVVARVGHEEFGVLLLETNQELAGKGIERLVEAVNAHNMGGPKVPLAISLGATVVEPGSDRTVEEVISRAERARIEQERQFAEK